MPDIAHEAMEALLVLHHPDKVKAWNPEAPLYTFWDVSSQVIFSISEKLIQHQIFNYTTILKWLREILCCRNAFLSQHKDYANVGSQIAISKQAHIKLEVRVYEIVGIITAEIKINLQNSLCAGRLLDVFVEYRHRGCSSVHVLFLAAMRGS